MNKKKQYSLWFMAPSLVIFLVMFILPVLMSFFFSFTTWSFDSWNFTGLDNFKLFFTEKSLNIGLKNTFLYAFLTSGLKVVIAFLLAVFLTSRIKTKDFLRSVIFFPNLVSMVAVGLTFKALMHPSKGLINQVLGLFGIQAVDWLGNTRIALFSVIGVDVWKGISIATVIFIAGIQSIDRTYYEAAQIDGAGGLQLLKHITFPLCRPALNSVIILSLIGGLKSFELIWAMTGGGPGYATDVISSIIYKQYAAGYYGLSTTGNVIMYLLIAVIAFPLQKFLMKSEEE
ncbi:sugar ABC transporter permease [Diplocloster hominis]|uniref:carbohydrate ABC transporter permease n=1 Tax=Diplocloster hominis TaxID=3079010 RepID=UPI0031BB03A6